MCTHSVPTDELDTPPGTRYSLDEQCAFKFGDGSTHYVSNKLLCVEHVYSTRWSLHVLSCMFSVLLLLLFTD